jgi:hypothetical protein
MKIAILDDYQNVPWRETWRRTRAIYFNQEPYFMIHVVAPITTKPGQRAAVQTAAILARRCMCWAPTD